MLYEVSILDYWVTNVSATKYQFYNRINLLHNIYKFYLYHSTDFPSISMCCCIRDCHCGRSLPP